MKTIVEIEGKKGISHPLQKKRYKEINKIINHNKPVLYIPLAMIGLKKKYQV